MGKVFRCRQRRVIPHFSRKRLIFRILNDNEIRTLAAYTKGVPIKKEYLFELKEFLLNSSTTANGTARTQVTLDSLANCDHAVNELKKEFGKKHRNK